MKIKDHKPAVSLYEQIAGNLEQQINKEVLKFGDKLPSIRTICRQYGVSMSTALQAYYKLEGKSLIEARPKSGYFVCYSTKKFPNLPQTSQPLVETEARPVDDVIGKVYTGFSTRAMTLLSLGVPANELLPIPKLNKALVRAMRELPGSGTGYVPVAGNEKLLRQIARGSYQWDGRLTPDELITTNGCSNALAYCLMAVTVRGDTVVVESPVYFGILQLAQNLGLTVIELPTHPHYGIEIDALKAVLDKKKVAACILISNFNNPIGSCMPDENKKAVVQLLARNGIPLVEDDIYGDVYFTATRPKPCKYFDEAGLVLWCGSVSKTLAPGYRVGWVAPGKFYDKIRKIKSFHALSSVGLTEEAVANFLENGRYESHLRKLRQVLQANCLQYNRAILNYFPEGTKVSRPQGGFFLWVELNTSISTLELFERALRLKISISPGRIFTLQNQFDNCMRLSYSLPWSVKIDQSLKTLGKLIRSY